MYYLFMPTNSGLNPRQETFAREIAQGTISASQAVRESGYSTNSNGAVHVQASRLLSNANVQQRIRSYSQSLLDQAGVSATEAVSTVADIMRSTDTRAADRLKASELVLKLDGALVDGARGDDNRVQVLATLGSGDLSALARLLETESGADRR